MSPLRPRRLPRATYRIQFHKSFTFQDALRRIPYWHDLGITDLYASPFLAARPGSLHGYDIVDPTKLNPEIGSDEDLDRVHAALESRGMGLVMDVVPNHMCVNSNDNVWWNDVLENGPSSAFAKFFDIDWRPPKTELVDKVLLPVLGEQYGRVLENGEFQLAENRGAFTVSYGDRRFPIGPGTYAMILDGALARLAEPDEELESIITASRRLPSRVERSPEKVRERLREKEIVKSRLADLLGRSPPVRQALDDELRDMNGTKGDPRSFDKLEALLAQQAYRLSYWRVAAEHINYRRFFDINDLAAVRMEEQDVLETVHAKVFDLVDRGIVTGLRIDHVDGLLNPKRYLDAIAERAGRPYVVVEKILAPHEPLPGDWATEGTTGYDVLNTFGGLFVAPEGEKKLRSFYDGFRTVRGEFSDIVYESKRGILEHAMSSELSVLARRLDRISEQHRWSRDFTIGTLELVLVATIACFPVYRTYVTADDADVSPQDGAHILAALAAAKRRNAQVSASAFDFLGEVLLSRDPVGLGDKERRERRDFVLRFQELTGPVAAKGLEDTAFYRYFPLLSLNEVGGGPVPFGVTIDEFHETMRERAERHPASLSATSTHDTKRAEDNRARLSVLSEIPDAWIAEVIEWRALAEASKTKVNGVLVPMVDSEYYIYQTVVGAWPLDRLEGDAANAFVTRVQDAVEKALREAKRLTSWIHPNQEYEDAVRTFVARILDPKSAICGKIAAFVERIRLTGLLGSLAQLVVKATAPGIPDFYQGTERWDFSMVDPDNRRPVDFEGSEALVREIEPAWRSMEAAQFTAWLRSPDDGRAKLYLTRALLRRRRAEEELFAAGAYVPLASSGGRGRNVVAFARRASKRIALTVAGRFFTELQTDWSQMPPASVWKDTAVKIPEEWAPAELEDVLSGRKLRCGDSVRVSELFEAMPFAVLVGTARS
jgi:(1->4)-alpha-D-glucan 1-alpha-D-glucosylmutase